MSVVQTRQQTARARASAQARARALPPRSRPRAATTQIIKNINNMNKSNIDVDFIKSSSRTHFWHWNEEDESSQRLVSNQNLDVCFHPECSESTVAIRGSRPLIRNGNYYFWEISVKDKIYGTSVMFGVCTKEQRLYASDYCNLIGLDQHGWSLSHKGHLWHNGEITRYTSIFPEQGTVKVGLFFDTMRGQLSYFMNGRNLGVAFSGLNKVNSELYPVVGSTAKCTRMRLEGAYCGYELNASLLERSCFTLLKSARDKNKLLEHMREHKVPNILINYLEEER